MISQVFQSSDSILKGSPLNELRDTLHFGPVPEPQDLVLSPEVTGYSSLSCHKPGEFSLIR